MWFLNSNLTCFSLYVEKKLIFFLTLIWGMNILLSRVEGLVIKFYYRSKNHD